MKRTDLPAETSWGASSRATGLTLDLAQVEWVWCTRPTTSNSIDRLP